MSTRSIGSGGGLPQSSGEVQLPTRKGLAGIAALAVRVADSIDWTIAEIDETSREPVSPPDPDTRSPGQRMVDAGYRPEGGGWVYRGGLLVGNGTLRALVRELARMLSCCVRVQVDGPQRVLGVAPQGWPNSVLAALANLVPLTDTLYTATSSGPIGENWSNFPGVFRKLAAELRGVLSDGDASADAPPSDEFSEAAAPGDWYKRFGISETTFRRYRKAGKIRVKAITSKLIRIHNEDVAQLTR